METNAWEKIIYILIAPIWIFDIYWLRIKKQKNP